MAAAAALLAGCGGAAGPAGHGSPAPAAAPLTAPLPVSFESNGTGYAVVPMGDLGQPLDTFWQLVTLRPAASGWTLVTPTGVADNGGLVVAAGAGKGALTAAFLPSGALTFSPLAATSDGGRTWSPAGLVPAHLAPVPDALAVAPGGSPSLALTTDAGGTVLTRRAGAGPGAAWTPLVTRHSLAGTAAGRACGLQRVTAVATGPDGSPLLGATCSRPVAGIFEQGASGWTLAPLPTAGVGAGGVSVLRLVGTPSGIAALLSGGRGSPWIAAARSGPTGRTWSMSPPFVLGAGARLVATTLPAGVVWRDGRDHLQAAVPNAAATRWTVLPSPPPGTEALAAVPAGALEALAVRRTTLTAWRLDQVADGWQEVQRLVVPIAFGSSG